MKRRNKISGEIKQAPRRRFSVFSRLFARPKFSFIIAVSILLCFGSFSRNLQAQDSSDDTPIKVDTLIVTIPLTVSDAKGRNVPGLKKNNFSIFQNGEEQDVELFLNEEAPMNVAILLDTSYSTKDVLDEIQDAARDFIKVLRPEDRALIVSFDRRTAFLSDLTGDRKILSRAIGAARINQSDGSDMPDAIASVINRHFAAIKGRKAIVVLTDGQVSGRSITAQQTLEMLQKSDVLLYPIIFTKNADRSASFKPNGAGKFGVLKILTEETAGRFYEKEAAKLKEAFQSIAADLRNQYLLGFYPQNGEIGKSLGHIRVAVDKQGYVVRAKKKLGF